MLVRLFTCCGDTRMVAADPDVTPLCGTCRGLMTWKQTREYFPGNHGWSTGMHAPAIDFNQTRERIAPIGEHGVPVNSLHDIRRIERESEKRARDGEGEQYVFRKYAQDANHLHDHTLGESPARRPDPKWFARQRQLSPAESRAISEAAAESTGMGPGAHEDLASAL